MTFTQTVIDRNSQTLRLLEDKDFGNAIQSSVHAMESCKHLLRIDCEMSGLRECLDHCMLQNDPQTSRQHQQQHHLHERPSKNGIFIYRQGIQIPTATTDLNVVIPILIFNAGLAHQLLAEVQEAEEDYHDVSSVVHLLCKAKALYQLARSMVENANDVNSLFGFCIINNISAIELRLGNSESSLACFCYLQARYLVMMHQGEAERLRHLDGFWLSRRSENQFISSSYDKK